MKSKAHSKKCQELGVLVSSLVDLEAEEGKNLSLSRAAVGAEGGAGPSQGPALLCRTSCHRFGEQFCSPRPLPGVSVCVGPCWGLHVGKV